MEKDHYIGVDISKKTIDVAIYVKEQAKKGTFPHETFQNTAEGFKDMKRWLRQGKRIIKIFPFHAAFCLTRISQITRKRIISLAFAIRTVTYER